VHLKYRLQGFVMAGGERYCLLVEPESAVPLFHPILFATTQVCNRSLSLSDYVRVLSIPVGLDDLALTLGHN